MARFADIPVINGGDGTGEHPTQGLLDIYTIKREFGNIDGLNIVIVGDLTVRVFHSLSYALAKYDDVKLTAVSPVDQQLPEEVVNNLGKMDFQFKTAPDVRDVISDADVLYLLGTKHGPGMSLTERERSEVSPPEFTINCETLKKAQDHAIVMHPMPRTDELPLEVDDTKFARYFEQAYNGLVVRMALLGLIFGKDI